MTQWWLTGEATLEDLLSDEMMGPVVASAGMNREQLRSSMAEVARRLGTTSRRTRGCREEAGRFVRC